MPKAAQKSAKRRATLAAQPDERPWQWLTQAAFFLTLVLVIARMTMQEFLRSDALPIPGGSPAPGFAGPTTSLLLDLICLIPAMLVLARQVFDADFVLRLTWSHAIALLLAIWTLLSISWSSDRYSTLVQAANWAAALAMFWTASQLVHSWLRLRLVAAISFGLLAVLLVQGYYYKFVDLPDLQRNWRDHHTEMLRAEGPAADATRAHQLELNILNGTPTGFTLSRNSYAALLVLLMIIAAGIALQRLRDGDSWTYVVPISIVIALGLWMLYRYVQSKTAFATPIIGAGLLALLWRRKSWSAARGKQAYWITCAFLAVAIAAVIGHGLKHGTLVHISLTFRWWYWVGAARLFVHHPFLGVGWGNFGPNYLAYRLPQAAEDPADPHNFIVRAFVELGVVGGILMIAWMLRLWWEMAVWPIRADDNNSSNAKPKSYSAIPMILAIALVATAVNVAASLDFSFGFAWVTLELFKRLMFLVAFVAATCFVAIPSFSRQSLDDRPAPFLLAAMLLALGLFLVHNLIDFSMFESGPMFFFALIAGAALGIRLDRTSTHSRSRIPAIAALSSLAVGSFIAFAAVWLPVARAADLANDADNDIYASAHDTAANARPDTALLTKAADQLTAAFDLVPYDAEYAFRAEQALLLARQNPSRMRDLLDRAIAADEISLRYRWGRASLETVMGQFAAADADYQRLLQLDSHNLELRTNYAHLLEQEGHGAEAIAQYREVLRLNDLLAADEIRRVSPKEVDEIQQSISKIEKTTKGIR